MRSGKEHHQLHHSPCQIQVIEKVGEKPYVQYTDVSKNNPGGLRGRKTAPKVVKHYANTEEPSWCFVQIFKLYNSLCPSNHPLNAFYLKPLSSIKNGCGFSSLAVGHNTLQKMMQNMCKRTSISGYKTNYSLRATTATRLFREGVDEQLIMERTGHQSVDGVRSYKRTASEKVMEISYILNISSKKINNSSTVSLNKADLAKIAFNNCTNLTININ